MQHLAIIMDGNRRWAKKYGMGLDVTGHAEGLKALQRVVEWALAKRIKYLSVYTFSIENFSRSAFEKNYIFNLIVEHCDELAKKFAENKVRIQFIGDRKLFPEQVMQSIERLENTTKHYTNLVVSSLFCYGGQQEIVAAVKNIAHDLAAGLVKQDDISESLFKKYLWTADLPEPDLIIRTGGAMRLSNFLLFQSAYSEFVFLDILWPEISAAILDNAVGQFIGVKRNFGV